MVAWAFRSLTFQHSDEGGSPPKCSGDFCPRLLSVAVHNETLFVFARTSDGHIKFRTNDGSSWADWFDLGSKAVGNFISQPTARSWKVGDKLPRLEVTVVSSSERTVYGRFYTETEGWAPEDTGSWIDRGGVAGSPVTMCVGQSDRVDFWMTDAASRNITHTWWQSNSNVDVDDKDAVSGDYGAWKRGNWQQQSLGSQAKSAPAIVCRNSKIYHDLIWYDNDEDLMWHDSFENDGGWKEPQSWEGKFIGDPTIYSFPDDPERWDFFGVQTNHKVYHLTWNSKPGTDGVYSELNSLGGSILSQPAVISLDKHVYDVVALGTDGELKHKHYDGTGWAVDWEGLGIRAHSAPNVRPFGDKVFILAISDDGSLLSWSRDAKVSEKWKDSIGDPEKLGGDLAQDFLTEDS